MELNIKDLIERIYYVVSDEEYYTIELYHEDGKLYDYDDDDNPDYDDDCYKILCDSDFDKIYDETLERFEDAGYIDVDDIDDDEFNEVYDDLVISAIASKIQEEYKPKKIKYPLYIEKDDEMVETGEFVTGEVNYNFRNYGNRIEISVRLDIY